MKPTLFRKPRTTRPLLVTFRNGSVAGPYPPHYIRWRLEAIGWPVAIVTSQIEAFKALAACGAPVGRVWQ